MTSNKRVLYHLFRSELNETGRSVNSKWRELSLVNSLTKQPITRWEEARYELEVLFHMHESTRKTSRLACLAGMTRDTFKKGLQTPLQPQDVIEPDMAVILVRIPLPRAFKPYVPLSYLLAKTEQVEAPANTVLWEEATEEEKLALIAAGDGNATKPSPAKLRAVRDHAKQLHPSDYERNDKNQPKPPPSYVCNGCLESGHHFRADCPRGVPTNVAVTVQDKPLDKVALPHGIPKRFLKKAQSNDQDAMLTKEGEWVQRGATPSLAVQNTTDSVPVTLSVLQRAMLAVDRGIPPVLPLVHDADDDIYFDFEPHVQRMDEVEAAAMVHLAKEYPHIRNKNRSMCTYWLRGICHKSVLCDFLHEYNTEDMPICRFYVQAKCTNDACGYKHIVSESAKRRDVCLDYALGFCPRGPKCGSDHIRRAAPTRGDFVSCSEAFFLQVVAAFDKHTRDMERREAAARKRFAHPGVFELLKRRKKQRREQQDEEDEEAE